MAGPKTATVEVEFGGQKVKVPQGGYYDRYALNPDLDEVARDPDVPSDLSFFRSVPKALVPSRVGPTYAPNFYYRASSIQLVLLAPISRLRTQLPRPLEPLTALPGYGLVALTFYSYHVCDNDPYNEVSIAIMVRRPDQSTSSTRQLISSIWNRNFFGHVLVLPVNTEIARVRGVYGYQFPKWLADIDVSMESGRITGSVKSADGKLDLDLDAAMPALKTVKSEAAISTSNAVNLIDGKLSQVTVRTNPLQTAQCLFPRGVRISRSGGPLSKILDELEVSTIVRMDVVKDSQMILYMPKPMERL